MSLLPSEQDLSRSLGVYDDVKLKERQCVALYRAIEVIVKVIFRKLQELSGFVPQIDSHKIQCKK